MMPTPNTNNSASGGYLISGALAGFPGNITFEEFLQTVFVGVSNLPGDLVRTKWQIDPPKQPDIYTNWLAIGLSENQADTFAFDQLNSSNVEQFQRMEELVVQCTFYGPNSLETMQNVRDGFQIAQNREALKSSNVDFVACERATRVPDLVNERWINRWEMGVRFRRTILRTYPILYFLSASGNLYVLGSNGVRTLPIPNRNPE